MNRLAKIHLLSEWFLRDEAPERLGDISDEEYIYIQTLIAADLGMEKTNEL